MHVVILSGGAGSRLWPLSRKFHPKPFIKLQDGKSALQSAFLSAVNLKPEEIINITSAELAFKVQEEWNELGQNNIEPTYVLEPFGKSTAAAVAIASLWVVNNKHNNELILIMPSDHLIANENAFDKAVKRARSLAEQGMIVTFGIKPNGPETGYGYIEFKDETVKSFIEKPSQEIASKFIASGAYLWNSGMLCFKASLMLSEMKKHCPDILKQCQACFNASYAYNQKILQLDATTFAAVRIDSIDRAVMEKSAAVSVVPCDIEWSDIGNWDALAKLLPHDENCNVVNAEAILEKSSGCYIEGHHRMISVVGIKDTIIVDTADALLVVNKKNVEDVKKIYNVLAKAGHPSHQTHATVHRPWGSYTVLENGEGFKIKRIIVNPGASLSLQSHKHRTEHWVVVSGQALVINGAHKLALGVSQSTYIPAGNKHRLSNSSSTDMLVIVEVQTGSYLGEDDIERYEDLYSYSQTSKHFRLA